MRPVLIGVAGGSGSGKTTIVDEIIAALGGEDVAVLKHDSYYRDRSHLSESERERINYDHPNALETDLLVAHLRELQAGRCVEIPIYDFRTHTRTGSQTVAPHRVIIVEGILILADPDLRDRLDIKIYVDTDPDIRLLRRLHRDMTERGRTMESVIDQYVATVRPMHLEFVEPSKRHADIIIPEGGYNRVGVNLLVTNIRSLLP